MWTLFYLRKIVLKFFFAGLLFVFEKLRMQKNSVFQAASFGDLLLNEKQKKPYYYFVEQQTGRLFIVYSTES